MEDEIVKLYEFADGCFRKADADMQNRGNRELVNELLIKTYAIGARMGVEGLSSLTDKSKAYLDGGIFRLRASMMDKRSDG